MQDKDMKKTVIPTMKRIVTIQKRCTRKVKVKKKKMKLKNKVMKSTLKKLISLSSMRNKGRSRKISGLSTTLPGLRNKKLKLKMVKKSKRREPKRNKARKSMQMLLKLSKAPNLEKKLILKS